MQDSTADPVIGQVDIVDARVASTIAGDIDIRLDSVAGPLIGIIKVPATDGTQTWKTVSTNISGTVGLHRLYLIYKQGGVGINWIKLRENSTGNVVLFQNTSFSGWSAKFDVGQYNT